MTTKPPTTCAPEALWSDYIRYQHQSTKTASVFRRGFGHLNAARYAREALDNYFVAVERALETRVWTPWEPPVAVQKKPAKRPAKKTTKKAKR